MAYNISKSGPIAATGVLHTVRVQHEKTAIVNVYQDDGGSNVIFEVSADNSTWLPAVDVWRIDPDTSLLVRAASSTKTRGKFHIDLTDINLVIQYVRARCVTYVSGFVDAEIDVQDKTVPNLQFLQEPKNDLIAFMGDSITAAGVNQNTSLITVNNNRGMQFWVPFLTRQRVRSRQNLNFGISGQNTRNMLGRFDQALNARPKYLVILAGTNDIGNVTLSETKNNLRAMWDKALDGGIRVIALCLTPRDLTAPNHDTLIQINQYIRSMRGYRPNFWVADATNDIVDKTSATGAAQSGYYYDTTHPKANAGYYHSKAVAAIINSIEPDPGMVHVNDKLDAFSATLLSGNMLTNGFTAGTAGTLGAFTGSVADSWVGSISSWTGAAIAAAKVASANKTWQQLTLSGSVTGGAASLAILAQSFGSFTNFAIGDLLEASCELEVDAGLAFVSGIGLQLRSTQNGTALSFIDGHAIVSDDMPTEAFTGIFRTPPMPLQFAPTTLDVQLRIYGKQASGTAAGVVRATNFSLRKIGA